MQLQYKKYKLSGYYLLAPEDKTITIRTNDCQSVVAVVTKLERTAHITFTCSHTYSITDMRAVMYVHKNFSKLFKQIQRDKKF